MSKSKDTTSERTESGNYKPERTGRIPCVLVYSDRKHVPYINNMVSWIEELLPDIGFEINKLGDETKPDEHFGENFERLAEECPFGIVILDGLRPNVIYEYGLLKGRGKVILPLQDKKAYIAVKSLYSIADFLNDKEIKDKTNLHRDQFLRLKEPPIGYFGQLSDRHGIKSVVIDCDAPLNSNEHPKNKIRNEIEKLMPKILQKYTEQSLKPVEKIKEHLKEFEALTLRVMTYYTEAAPLKDEDVETLSKEIRELEKKSNVTLPSTVYGTIAALHERLAEETRSSNSCETAKHYEKAIEIYKGILKVETDSPLSAMAQYNMGNAYGNIAYFRDEEANLKLAIKTFEEALTIYTKEGFPRQYASTQSSLGLVYTNFSYIKDKQTNLKLAIKALKEALMIYTKESYPTHYANVQKGIGTAYVNLAAVRDTEANLKLAIKGFEEALTIYTKEGFPVKYAHTQSERGLAYYALADVRNTEANLELAIKAYKEALTIYTKENFPREYFSAQQAIEKLYARRAIMHPDKPS